MDDDGEIERALRRVVARHGSSLLADNDALGRQLRFELGDSAFDDEATVVALLKVLRSGALRDIEVGDLGGAYRTATAANPGIAHEAADWSVAVLDRVTGGRSSSASGVRSRTAAAEPTARHAATADDTRQIPATSVAATSGPATTRQPVQPTQAAALDYDARPAWPTRAKVLVALLAAITLGAAAAAGFFAMREDSPSGTEGPVNNTPDATTIVTLASTTVAPTTVAPTTTTIAPTTTVAPTTTTTVPVIVEVGQLKGAGPVGTYTLNVITAACNGLVGCEQFPTSLTAAAQDANRLVTVNGIFAIPVAFAGGIGPWNGTGTGVALGTADCGNITAANWTVTVDVTAAQLAQPPFATGMNYAFRAAADAACPTQGTAEFTGTLRRTA